jgi:hypothetical protein
MHYENSLHKDHEYLNLRSESAKIFTSLKLYSKNLSLWTNFSDGSGAYDLHMHKKFEYLTDRSESAGKFSFYLS